MQFLLFYICLIYCVEVFVVIVVTVIGSLPLKVSFCRLQLVLFLRLLNLTLITVRG